MDLASTFEFSVGPAVAPGRVCPPGPTLVRAAVPPEGSTVPVQPHTQTDSSSLPLESTPNPPTRQVHSTESKSPHPTNPIEQADLDDLIFDLQREQEFIDNLPGHVDLSDLTQLSFEEREIDSDVPLICCDHTDLPSLLRNSNLEYHHWTRINAFLRVCAKSDWTANHHDLAARIGIVALSTTTGFSRSFCYCGIRNHVNRSGLCHQVRFCPRCNWAGLAKPLLDRFQGSFRKADFWYLVTVTFTNSVSNSCFVYEDHPGQFFRRGSGDYDAAPVSLSNLEAIGCCYEIGFAVARQLTQEWGMDGAICNREMSVRFCPEGCNPHVHIVCNSSVRADEGTANDVYDFCRRCIPPGIRLHPRIHICRLHSQEELNRALRYIVKPTDFVSPYRSAINRGRSLEDLNLEVDNIFWQEYEVARTEGKRSPVRYGNMAAQTRRSGSYIGN